MIAAVWRGAGLAAPERRAIASALASPTWALPRYFSRFGTNCWGAAESRDALFFGRLDKPEELADALGLCRKSPFADLYSAALRKWGDDADLRLVGHYCAIVCEGPERLRLVRSPWTAPPLHFAASPSLVAASPLLGALFAAGAPQRIDWEYLADQLAYDHRDCEPCGWYENIGRVPLGSRVRIDGGDWSLERYYDPVAIEPVRHATDEDYVDRAHALLRDASRFALQGVARPAMMLSGGLDSPLAANAILDVMPQEARLHSYTFGPHPDWDGWTPGTCFGEERGRVRAFAALHPRLEPHFPPEDGGHDYRLRDLLALTHAPTANIANIGIFHPLFAAAKADGCDAMLTALHGNFTYSLVADWAAPEALAQGRWKHLKDLLPADKPAHSLARRILSQAVLPRFSPRLQHEVRKAFHPERFARRPLGSLLSREATEAWRKRAHSRGSLSAFDMPPTHGTRAGAIRAMWASADSGEDLDLGMERLYGMAHRDVAAYRPLFEFCHGLPTGQLHRGRTDRYLARRMAKGIMPEAQRLDLREGRHNVDWHARMTMRREGLLGICEALRGHGELSHILDLDRMTQLLTQWPEATPGDRKEQIPREMGLSRALTAATFVSHAQRRNDF